MALNDKKLCLSHSIFQEAYIIWSWFLVHKCKMMTSLDSFFILSKFCFVGLLGGVEGQKMAQNEKKFCMSHSLSQKPYLIWFWFLVYICKMMISAGFFFFLQFLGVGVIKGQKMTYNYQFHTISHVDHIIKIFGTQV